MNTPYQAYPTLDGMPINERVQAFKETCLRGIKSGQLTQADLLQATEEALQMQAYELAQGIELARQTFVGNPQLSLL
jgi:hypothetical protein